MTNVVHEMMGELPVRDTLPEHEKRRQRLPADARVGQILDERHSSYGCLEISCCASARTAPRAVRREMRAP